MEKNALAIFTKNKKEITDEEKQKRLQSLLEKIGTEENKDKEEGYVYLVIDCSGSMGEKKLNQTKRGVIDFVFDAEKKGYLCGLIQFHSFPTHLCELTEDISLLKKRIEMIESGDSTFMAEAIKMAHQILRDKDGHRVIVIATDGYPNGPGDPKATLEAGENAKKDEIDIITIGTDDADKNFLKKLATTEELSKKVARQHFGPAIALMAKKLPEISAPKRKLLPEKI